MNHSLFDKIIDPLDIKRLGWFSPLRILLPWIIINDQKQDIGERLMRLRVFLFMLFLHHIQMLLVDLVHVGILLFGLKVTSIA